MRGFITIGTAATVVVLTLATVGGAAPTPSSVTVANTAQNPAIVQVTGTPNVQVTGTPSVTLSGTPSVTLSGSPSVSLDDAGNDVEVNSSKTNPVYVREAPEAYGDTMSMSASNGNVTCQQIDLALGRVIRLEGVMVSISGGGTPHAWLEVWGELAPGGGAGVAGEIDIPLNANQSQFFSHSGMLAPGLPIGGGSEFDNDGKPARVSGCIRAQASGSSTGRFFFSGVYLD